MNKNVLEYLLSNSQFGLLREQFKNNGAAHAFLIECPDEFLRNDALRLLSAFAVCNSGGCLDCPECRRALKGVHCDVKFFPSDAEKGKITVADTDSLLADSVMKPLNAKNKVYLLDASISVGRDDWQNKLLKTLEEPPANTFIFISVANADSLLQTVRSRCEIIRIGGMADEKIFDALIESGVDEKSAGFAVCVCHGQLSKAFAVAKNSEYAEMARFAADMFARLKNTKKTPPFVAELVKKKDSAYLFFEMAEVVMREATALSAGVKTTLGEDFGKQLKIIATDFSAEAMALAISHLENAKRRVDNGGNFVVVADELIIKILEDKYRCRK